MANLIFILVVACLYAAVLRYPGAACGYVLAGPALEQSAQAFVPIASGEDALCNYLIAGAVVVGLVARIAHDRVALPRLRASSLWVLGLLGYCYLTAAWSIFPKTTLFALNHAVPYLVTFVGIAPLLVRSEEDLEAVLIALLFSSLLALGLLLLFGEWGQRGVMLPGKRLQSNPLALAESAGCLLIVTVLAPIRTRLTPALRLTLLWLVFVVTALVFLRTASRGQVLAAVAVTLAFSVRQRGGWWILVALGVGVLLSSSLFPDELAKHAARWDPGEMRDAVGMARIHQAERLLTFWANSSTLHQVFGLGHAASQDPRLLGNYPHVVPAEVLGEEGMVGALIFTGTILVGSMAHIRGLKQADPDARRIFAATAALFAFEFILIWKQGSLLGASPFLLLLTLAPEQAKLTARARAARSSAREETRAFAQARLVPQRLRTRAR